MAETMFLSGDIRTDEKNTVICPHCGNIVKRKRCSGCDDYYYVGHKSECPKMHGPRSDDHTYCAPVWR